MFQATFLMVVMDTRIQYTNKWIVVNNQLEFVWNTCDWLTYYTLRIVVTIKHIFPSVQDINSVTVVWLKHFNLPIQLFYTRLFPLIRWQFRVMVFLKNCQWWNIKSVRMTLCRVDVLGILYGGWRESSIVDIHLEL